MSLIRCPGCKLDTSDSLDHCPNCGAGLNGQPARTMEAQIGGVTTEAWSRAPSVPGPAARTFGAAQPSPAPASRAATQKAPHRLLQGFIGLIVLILLTAVPSGLAWVILGAVLYAILRARKSVSSTQIETFRRFAEQAKASRASAQAPAKQPLELLRQIETEIDRARHRDDDA